MGKIYKKLGEKKQALQAYTMALELDQKDTNMVKTLIDKLHSDDDMHEENGSFLWALCLALPGKWLEQSTLLIMNFYISAY